MRTRGVILLAGMVLAVLNYGIYEKEQIKANGETVLLELAPVDPRSLMQGDYMRLRYAIERQAPAELIAAQQKRGYMVVRLDENNVGQFARLYQQEELGPDEKRLHFHKKYNALRIVPDSFLFQEGHRELYEAAKYGVFKFDGSGNHILIGLADENRKVIRPE